MITFYDIAARDPIRALCSHTWKMRYVLNYKELSYKTIYLTFPDIPKEFTRAGIPSHGQSANGLVYTCPSVINHLNNKTVMEPFDIALYLDRTYPDTPKVIPPGTEALQAAFHEQFNKILGPLWPFLLPKMPAVLHPGSRKHFIQARARDFGKPLADVEPKGEERVKAWEKVQVAFDTLHGQMNESSGPYFMGETVTFADFVIVGLLNTVEVSFGESSEEWKDIMTWNNGKWATLKKSLEKYANTDS